MIARLRAWWLRRRPDMTIRDLLRFTDEHHATRRNR